jgi:hypothetical protein
LPRRRRSLPGRCRQRPSPRSGTFSSVMSRPGAIKIHAI